MNILINLALYQINWFVLVLGGNERAWIALLLLILHFFLSPSKQADAILVATLTVAGLLIDGSLHAVGFFTFPQTGFLIPYWLIVLWMTVAILPNHSLAWLKGRPLRSSLFGALGGPLAYWAGIRLGAASFTTPLPQALLTLAVIWAILWPAVMFISTRINR